MTVIRHFVNHPYIYGGIAYVLTVILGFAYCIATVPIVGDPEEPI